MNNDTIVLNGQKIESVDIGGGQVQIDYFKQIEQYTKSHTLHITTGEQPSKFQGMHDIILMGEDKRFKIIAVRSYIPGIVPPLAQPRYQSYIQNKNTGQEVVYYGTISGHFWKMLNSIREKQK